jgi:predicted  nucleic acid-binding Zn-ribbon protein
MSMEAVIKDLQDTLTVMVEIERRQSKMLLEHSERLVSLEDQISEDRRETAKFRRESAEFQKRTDQNLAEITDKLNGLIGYVGNWKQPPQQPS